MIKVPGFNIGQEWLLALTKLGSPPKSEQTLRRQLCLKGHYLCEGLDLKSMDRKQLLKGKYCGSFPVLWSLIIFRRNS